MYRLSHWPRTAPYLPCHLTAPNANVPAQISQLALIPLMERRAPARRASEDLIPITQTRLDCGVIKAGLWRYKDSVTPLPSLCNDTWLTSRGHLADTLPHHHYKDLYVTASNCLYTKAVGENMAHWHLISSNKLFVQQIMK